MTYDVKLRAEKLAKLREDQDNLFAFKASRSPSQNRSYSNEIKPRKSLIVKNEMKKRY